jgi:glycosyltransferase involved in cell wall biosynthesis
MFGDEAVRARYEALLADHVLPAGAPRRPRVLFVSHNLNQGEGAPTSLLQTVTGLAATGAVEPHVFAVMEGDLAAAYQAAGIPLTVPEVGRRSRLAAQMIAKSHDQMARAFGATLRQVNPDLVVVNTAASLWFANLAQEAGLPTIAMIRESSAEHVGFAFGPPAVMAACQRGLMRADRVVFVSGHTLRLWQASHALAHPVVIPNGIALGGFAADRTADRLTLRAELGLDPEDLVLLSVGSINPRKAQIDIIRALAVLSAPARAQVQLVLVGARPSAYLEELQAVVAGLDAALAGRIRIEEETNQVGRWYRAADVFVFASHNESYPRVIVEAMGFGLPIVSSAVFGTREQIVPGESGLLFPPGDVAALAATLEEVVMDADKRARLAQGALDRVWALVTYPEMVHRYAVQFGQTLAERGAGSRLDPAKVTGTGQPRVSA